jgi:hypothetical protein
VAPRCLECGHPCVKVLHVCFPAWLPGQTPADSDISDPSSYSAMCLGIQWMPSPTPALPSGLYWQSQRCNAVGGYVCKRGNQGKLLLLKTYELSHTTDVKTSSLSL